VKQYDFLKNSLFQERTLIEVYFIKTIHYIPGQCDKINLVAEYLSSIIVPRFKKIFIIGERK
jgi:hypothetical protein